MAQTQVNIGTANARDGDNLRSAFSTVNLNATDAESRLAALETDSLDNVVIVKSQADLPAVSGGVIPLESKAYWLDAFVTIDTPLQPPKNGVCLIRGVNAIANGLNFTGSGALFQNTDFGAGFLFVTEGLYSATGAQLVDITGTSFGSILFNTVVISGASELGQVTNCLFSCIITTIADWGQGWTLTSNNGLVYSEITHSAGRNEVGAEFLNISGTQGDIQLSNAFLITAGANETILNIAASSTTEGGLFSAVDFNTNNGGAVLAAGSKNQSDYSYRVAGCKGLPDSTVSGKLSFDGGALTTTMSAEDTPVRINGIWTDGSLEERILFRDKLTFDNTTNTLTSVDGEVDATGGSGYAHTMTNSDIVMLKANGGLPTGLTEDTIYYVGDSSGNTFRLYSDSALTTLVTFTTDGTEPNYFDHSTGSSASGWFVYTGLESTRLALFGWLTIEKASGSNQDVRGVIMITNTSYVVSRDQNCSKVAASNGVPSSSQIADIIELSTDEGFLVYVENPTGGGTGNNNVTDAIMICEQA